MAEVRRPSLDLFDIRPGDLRFLHVVSRWQLGTPGLDRDPLSPWYGEASNYEGVAPGRGALQLHPSRVVRFLGNPWPDPSVAPTPWSDSILQALSDAVHAVALIMAGATSLMHEARPCRVVGAGAAPDAGALRPVIAASEGIDPGALDVAFRPLWQRDAARAALRKTRVSVHKARSNIGIKTVSPRIDRGEDVRAPSGARVNLCQ